MKKGTNVVCKNCGTEFVWGKKRKLSGGQNIAFYLCYFFMILLTVILGQWMFYSLVYLEFGLFIIALCFYVCFCWPCIIFIRKRCGFYCPECQSYKCVPSNTPVAKQLADNK